MDTIRYRCNSPMIPKHFFAQTHLSLDCCTKKEAFINLFITESLIFNANQGGDVKMFLTFRWRCCALRMQWEGSVRVPRVFWICIKPLKGNASGSWVMAALAWLSYQKPGEVWAATMKSIFNMQSLKVKFGVLSVQLEWRKQTEMSFSSK